MAFWNMASVEPKRNFRYKVTFGGNALDSNLHLFAQKVKKPTYKLDVKEYQYLNHTFKYPGRVKWEPSSIDFVDAGGSGAAGGGMLDVASQLMKIIVSAGYHVPSGGSDAASLKTVSKDLLATQVGDVTVENLNSQGFAIETWKMYNCMFTDVDFKEVGYDSDEFSIITVGLAYDYATLTDRMTSTTGGGLLPPVS